MHFISAWALGRPSLHYSKWPDQHTKNLVPASLQIYVRMDLGEGHRYEVKEGIMRRNGVWFMDSTGTSCGPGEACKPLFWRQPQLEAPLQACD